MRTVVSPVSRTHAASVVCPPNPSSLCDKLNRTTPPPPPPSIVHNPFAPLTRNKCTEFPVYQQVRYCSLHERATLPRARSEFVALCICCFRSQFSMDPSNPWRTKSSVLPVPPHHHHRRHIVLASTHTHTYSTCCVTLSDIAHRALSAPLLHCVRPPSTLPPAARAEHCAISTIPTRSACSVHE